MTAVRIVLSLALPLAFGLAPRPAAVISTRAVAVVLAAGAAVITAGSIAGSVPLAVSDLTVTIAALGGGVLLGRALPPRPRVMVIFLATCSAAGIIQNALISGGPSTASRPAAAAAAWRAYTVLRIAVPGGHYDIGPLDLLLFTAIGEHWRRRGGGWV